MNIHGNWHSEAATYGPSPIAALEHQNPWIFNTGESRKTWKQNGGCEERMNNKKNSPTQNLWSILLMIKGLQSENTYPNTWSLHWAV
jgi:hypothetical protein